MSRETVNSPSVPGITTWLASSDNNMRSGVTSSNLNVSAISSGPREARASLLRRCYCPWRRSPPGLQLGAAKRAEEHRVVDGISFVLVTVEAEQRRTYRARHRRRQRSAARSPHPAWHLSGYHSIRQNCRLHFAPPSPSSPVYGLCRRGELFRLSDRLLDRADHVERLLR